MDAGAVDDEVGLDGTVAGGNAEPLFAGGDGIDCKIAPELGTVIHGVAGGRDGKSVGAYDPRGGTAERHGHIRGNMWLKPEDFLFTNEGKTWNAVAQTAFVQFPDGSCLLIRKGEDHRSVVAVGNPELFGQRLHFFGAAPIEPRLSGARCWVVSAVHDSAVGAGGSAGNVITFFEQKHAQAVPGQLTRRERSDYAGADNGNIKFHEKTSFRRQCRQGVYPSGHILRQSEEGGGMQKKSYG